MNASSRRSLAAGLLVVVSAIVLAIAAPLLAQTAPPPALPAEASHRRPADVYKEAMQPLDVVRNSLENWSDPELAALAAGMRKAKQACGEANLTYYSGEDLYDLARLCALGQDWNATNTAALKYVQQGQDAPRRARAYALSINALIHLNGLLQAEETARRMLQQLPYDAAVEESVSYLTTYLAQSLDPAAMELASLHRPLLIDAIATGVPLQELHGNDAVSLGALYDCAMQGAFLERYAGADQDAAVIVAELKGALGKVTAVAVEDQRLIAAIDLRYSLLGARLPSVEAYKSLQSPTAKPKISLARGSITVLVLFPEWCTQCRKMMKPMTVLALKAGATKLHVYGLLFEDAQQRVLESGVKAYGDESFKDLLGTSTLLVSPTMADMFGAIDYPMAIVTDRNGNICFLGTLASNAFAANGFMEQIVSQAAERPIQPQPVR
jgi:hypothetical protein